MNKAVIFGASGLVGNALYRHLSQKGWHVLGTYHNTRQNSLIRYSLNQDTHLPKELCQAGMGIICSTYGSIDACKRDLSQSRAVNVEGTIRLIDQMKSLGMKPIFCSTDYVYSGKKGNYAETDSPDAVTVYGAQKVEVENHIRENCPNALIVRFSKIFTADPHDNGMFSQWYQASKNKQVIKCALDQRFSPTYVGDIVQGLTQLLKKESTGIFHLCRPVSHTRFTLWQQFAAYLKLDPCQAVECTTSELNFFDNRSKNTSMDPQKFIVETGFRFSTLKHCFELFHHNLKKEHEDQGES